MRRPLVLGATVLVGLLVCASLGIVGYEIGQWDRRPPEVLAGVSDDEACLLNAVNAERALAGVATLPVSPALTTYARTHSEQMAAAGDIYHTGGSVAHPEPGADAFRKAIGPPWNAYPKVGENVGEAPGCSGMMYGIPGTKFKGYMGSPPHRANILDRAWTAVGVGVAYDSGGQLYSTQEFMKAPPSPVGPIPLPAPPTPKDVPSSVRTFVPPSPQPQATPAGAMPFVTTLPSPTTALHREPTPGGHTTTPAGPVRRGTSKWVVVGTLLSTLGFGAVLTSAWLWVGSLRGRKVGAV